MADIDVDAKRPLDLVALEYIDGCRFHVVFSDGASGVADLEPVVHELSAMSPLRDLAVLRDAVIEGGTIAWPGGLDLAVERLYELARRHPQS
jgi:hypothetical protein